MSFLFTRTTRFALTLSTVLAFAAPARADEIKVLTTGILKGAFTHIATEFERQSGHKVTMSWGPSSGNSPEASPVRVRSGEALDVLIMVDAGMDDLVRTGHFTPLHRRDVAVSRIGVAVKQGQPLPDISTTAAFRQALVTAKSVGYSEGASGAHFIKVVVPKLGLTQALAVKGQVVLGRRFVAEEVAEGTVELGIQQLSELRLEPGITVVGPLPEELQKLSVVSAAVSSKSQAGTAGLQFLEFLATPSARQALRDSGLDLPTQR
jgi:molybdate transport system substrate-binding protein